MTPGKQKPRLDHDVVVVAVVGAMSKKSEQKKVEVVVKEFFLLKMTKRVSVANPTKFRFYSFSESWCVKLEYL